MKHTKRTKKNTGITRDDSYKSKALQTEHIGTDKEQTRNRRTLEDPGQKETRKKSGNRKGTRIWKR